MLNANPATTSSETRRRQCVNDGNLSGKKGAIESRSIPNKKPTPQPEEISLSGNISTNDFIRDTPDRFKQ